ncbi:MAG: GerMN domain-containing protein [Clostridia bacterium]|nr:GerMN domain-containing protein [Clostridia bacterium]
MKKFISILVVAVLLLTFFSACDKKGDNYNVYFKNKLENKLSSEERFVGSGLNAKEIAKLLIAEMEKGPQSDKNERLVPKGTKLLSIAIKNEVATINFSKNYSKVDGVEALLLRFAVVNTLCGIDGIKGVVIQVEGKGEVSSVTGKEIGVLTLSDIALDVNETELGKKETIVLYFPSKDGDSLIKERRTVEVENTLSAEKTVINELMKGSKDENSKSAIPEGTKLLGIETKDNVCFVNLSSDFISRGGTSSLETTLTLFSVVNSLCEIDNVKSVQILINGETGLEFGNYVLDIPYEANSDITKG